MLRRRSLLLGGLGAIVAAATGGAAVETEVLPGRLALERALGRCDVDPAVPTEAPGRVRTGSFASAARRGRTLGWAAALPPDADPRQLPVVLVLPGRGGLAGEAQALLSLDRHLAHHVAGGGRQLVAVTVDAGETYWHPRRDDDDALRLLTTELLPAVRAAGLPLREGPVGVLGWSMGGYGALLLARESAAGRTGGMVVAAAAAASPALFPSYRSCVPGAFDDEADWRRWGDLVGMPTPGVALRVECGGTDAFAEQTRRFLAAARPAPAGGISRGCHDSAYWSSRLPAQLAFLAAHL